MNKATGFDRQRIRTREGFALYHRLALACLLVLGSFLLPAMAGATYTDHGDGTVTDTTTGLVWKHCAEGQTWTGGTCTGARTKYNWNQANALTDSVSFAGKSDWRLPTLGELTTLIRATSYTPTISSIDATAFPNQNDAFWSSTTASNNAANAWYVNFIYGLRTTFGKYTPIAVHLVRGAGTGVIDDGNIFAGLTLAMIADDGKPVTSVTTSAPALIKATVSDDSGNPVANAIVTFTVDPFFGAFAGGANTALTDANGVATVKLTTANTSGGASTVTASTIVNGIAVNGSLNFAIGSTVLSLSAIKVPAVALSAYGTANVSVNVLSNGVPYTTPITVSFTSDCAASGKATLTPSVTTVNGKAIASYLDNGCNNADPGDTITATLLNGVTATAKLKVSSPAIGSLQFVSVATNPATTPPMITLKGTGGVGKSETARVTFRVVDSAGNPLGNTKVNFRLNTSLGGLKLTSTSASSDPSTGDVVTHVQAGTMSTVVRVSATTGAMYTQSDLLYISTGIPAQDSISLSASDFNIEGWNFDGEITNLTVRLADHFHNPVLDGTVVYFTSEGGAVDAGCTIANNACTVELTTQALRPNNGRVTVLARTTGEEAFTDLNSNGTVDDESEMIDANGHSTDTGEAYLDYNENGVFNRRLEPYYDFNGNSKYNGSTLGGWVGSTTTGDGKYNGLLCTAGEDICSKNKSIDVRDSIVIVFSTSNAKIQLKDASTIALPACNIVDKKAGDPKSVTVTVVDQHGNAMPVGTQVEFAADSAEITSNATFTVPNTNGCRTGYPGCPASAGTSDFGDLTFIMQSDGVYDSTAETCTNEQASGFLTVTVTTPKGLISYTTIPVTD